MADGGFCPAPNAFFQTLPKPPSQNADSTSTAATTTQPSATQTKDVAIWIFRTEFYSDPL